MATDRPSELLMGWELGKRLLEAGVIGPDVTRCVIDVPASGAVRIFIERIGTRKLLDVALSLQGVQIETVEAGHPAAQAAAATAEEG